MHAAVLLVSLSFWRKWRCRRSAAGAARRRRCCSCRCRRGASGVFVGHRGCGSHAAVLLVSLSLRARWRGRRSDAGEKRTRRRCFCRCRHGASGVVVGRSLVRGAGGAAPLVFVVLAQVACSSVGRGCGAHAAALLVLLSSGGKWRGHRSLACAARRRRCCSCRCRRGAGGVVVCRPQVRSARREAALFYVDSAHVACSSVGRGCGSHAAELL